MSVEVLTNGCGVANEAIFRWKEEDIISTTASTFELLFNYTVVPKYILNITLIVYDLKDNNIKSEALRFEAGVNIAFPATNALYALWGKLAVASSPPLQANMYCGMCYVDMRTNDDGSYTCRFYNFKQAGGTDIIKFPISNTYEEQPKLWLQGYTPL